MCLNLFPSVFLQSKCAVQLCVTGTSGSKIAEFNEKFFVSRIKKGSAILWILCPFLEKTNFV